MKLDKIFDKVSGQKGTMSLQEKETSHTKVAQLCPTSDTKAILSTMKGIAAENGYDFRAHFPGGCYPVTTPSDEYQKNRINAHIDITGGEWRISPSLSLG